MSDKKSINKPDPEQTEPTRQEQVTDPKSASDLSASNVSDSDSPGFDLSVDTSVSDASVSDASVSDASVSDASVSDAAVSDAAVSDAAVSDSVDDRPESCNLFVVGIGASAGGLEALEAFFTAVPDNPEMAFVVVQHLSPDFKSHMDQLLRRVTSLNVKVVTNGVEVEANTIYLIPPRSEMVISNGKLLLTERTSDKGVNHPIDHFFRSLAQNCFRYAIGIVLSGTGSDGSRGIVEIADNGGLVLAQDPASCKFDAMPLNAQEAGCVHLVLPPASLAEAVVRYVSEGVPPDVLRDQQIGELEEKGLKRVFQLLQREHQIDFSSYKSGTVERRIERRMELLSLNDLDDYVKRLNNSVTEINDLYKDLLIGVTRFFRDAEAFEYLQTQVFPKLIEKHAEEELRIWVCGCATGEEAYSLAIGLIEAYQAKGLEPTFKMFATDAHKESLQFAANGVFHETKMKEVSQERRERFFDRRGKNYSILSSVRRHVVFAPHNVINDPPFTQMHLVTCRNLLIYFQPLAQRKTLSLFHFALRHGGILFLGPSESPGEISDEFEPLEKTWKIFRKRRDIRLPVDMRLPIGRRTELRGMSATRDYQSPSSRKVDIYPALYDCILADLMPPSVLIDSRQQLLHAFPGSEDYLRFAIGRPTRQILDLVYPGIKNSVAAAIQHALKDERLVRYSGMPHPSKPDQQVRLVVRPYKIPTSNDMYLLLQFESKQSERPELIDGEFEDVDLNIAATTRIETLERDLSYTQQNLQATIEELETSNEELQATNEEMVAANEELQSTNEELHSVNEELYTVNAEHQKRVKELDEAQADMNNLLATTRVGVIFLDNELYIRRFTPAISKLLEIETHDIGRKFEGYLNRIQDSSFISRLNETLEERVEKEWEIVCDGSTYLVRAMPYWAGDEVAGVVISFVNVNSIKKTEAELARFKFMADMNVDAQILINAKGEIVYANCKMAESLGYEEDEILKLSVMDFDTETELEEFKERFEEAQEAGGLIFETTHVRKDGSRFPVESAITYVVFGEDPFLFANIRDITIRRRAEANRRLLEKAMATVENGIVISDPMMNDNPITFANQGFLKITGYEMDEVVGKNCRLLQGEETDPKAVVTIRDAIRSNKPVRVTIRNYRKDGIAFWNDVYITPVVDAHGETIAFVGVQSDVTDRINSNQKLEERERLIRSLLDSTAEGIFGVNSEGICTFCNSSALRMLGYRSIDDIIGQHISDLSVPQDEDAIVEESPILVAITTGEAQTSEDEEFRRCDGTTFPVEYWCHPLLEFGTCTGAVVTFFDTTLKRKQLEDLTQAREEADSANKAKSRFLANMSHELRTPLSAILGFTQILQQDEANPETQERLETIHRNGEYLLRLLNDVLDLSRIESGKFLTSAIAINLEEMLSDVFQTMEMRTHDYGTHLRFHHAGPLPETITSDPARLRQILINLIGNAIKFAPDGNVEVTTSVVQDSEQNDKQWLVIKVADDGIGMSEQQLNNLFQPFSQADATIEKRFGGTGLGLSITSRLIEVLRGSIEVESTEGLGSCFTIRVPVDPVGERKELRFEFKKSQGEDTNHPIVDSKDIRLDARVLVADDMRDVRFVAEHFLKRAGCVVDAAENGFQAIDKINQAIQNEQPFDLVLMDVQMPEMDGIKAVKEIRQLGIEIPVVALTADAMKGTRRRLIEMGFDEYLPKPLDVRRLLGLLHKILSRR